MDIRWKNYGLWVALASLVGLILNDFGLTEEQYNPYIDVILMVLVAAGIISNPKEGKGFKDKK